MNRRRWLILGLAGVLVLGLGVFVARELAGPERVVRGPVIEFGVLPPGTPTPGGYRGGIVVVRDSANYAVSTPRPGQIGTHYELRPTAVGTTPNWSAAETAIVKAASKGLKTWLSVNIFDNARRGTPDAPYIAPTVAYADGCGNIEYAPDYRALATPYAAFVQAVTDKFNADANVAGYVYGPGVAEEAVNTYQLTGDCASKRANLEKVITCEQYVAWVRAGAQIWAERTDKPVTVAAGAAACVGEYANTMEKTNQLIFGSFYPATPVPGSAAAAGVTPTPIYGLQYRSNGLRLDGGDEWNWSSGWGKLQTGQRLAEVGGAAYEFGTLGYQLPAGCADGFPCAVPTAERVGYTSDAAWKAMSDGAANLFWQCHATYGCWPDYLSADARYAITKTMGLDWTNSPAVWLRFADAVKGRVGNRSDQPGPWGFLAAARGVAGTQPMRYCAPSVYATAVASGSSGYATPAVCQQQLSAPVAPESRYAMQYGALTAVGIDVDDRWVGRSGTFTAWVIYLDAGTDTFEVAWWDDGAEQTRTVTKTDSHTWKKESWILTGQMRDAFGDHDLEIRTLNGSETFYLVWIENLGTISAPTPTMTPGQTPTVTPGASATPAPATITGLAETGLPDSVTLYRAAPDTTHADAEHEVIGWYQSGASQTALLHWPELALPPNAWVVSATLTLYVNGPLPAVARLREVARPVSLAAATWQHSGASLWAAGGGLGAGDTAATGQLLFVVPQVWYPLVFRVDESVRHWLQEGGANNGWLLDLIETQGDASTQAEVAGARHPLVQYRPVLRVWVAWSVTPTPTRTPSPTPTVIATGTPLPTPTGTPTATPTPATGVWLSELCLNPTTDLNLDGAINASDRAVELLNWQAGELDLHGWRLVFSTGAANCATTVAQTTFDLPRGATVRAFGAKVVYGRDLRNLLGAAFGLPGGSNSVSVLLCDPAGRQRDGIVAPALSPGSCLARSGAGWVKTWAAGLGR